MSSRLPRKRAVAAALCVAWVYGCGGGQESAQESESVGHVPTHAPNVLVLTIDTLRADHLGAYGYERETSPRLDQLAEESVVFEYAYAPIATTLPSHTSMFTGVYPHEHGVLANISDGMTFERDPALTTLAEFLGNSGYDTRAVVSAFPLQERFGLADGFEGYSQPKRKQRGAKAATTAAIEALDELGQGEAPGFLWVHYFDPHVPYHPPEAYRDRFELTEAELDQLFARGFVERAQRRTGEWNSLDDSIDLYDAEIAFVDDQVARLLDHAEETGWLKGAVIAVMADHGEGLNQHGMPGHGFIWGEQLRVPMWFHAPSLEPSRMPDPVSLVDFAPTLLHLLRLPGEEEFLAQMSGVDRLATGIHHEDARILGQGSPLQSLDGNIHYTIQAGGWRLHLEPGGRTLLFELKTDPDEMMDVSDEHPTVVERLSRDLDEQLSKQGGTVRTREASDEVREELRALGYGGDD